MRLKLLIPKLRLKLKLHKLRQLIKNGEYAFCTSSELRRPPLFALPIIIINMEYLWLMEIISYVDPFFNENN